MKHLRNFALALTLVMVICLALPSNVSAAPLPDDRTIFGSTYTLESGRILDGNLNVIGGVVAIEQNATVNGDMFVVGGLVDIDGIIEGNLTVIGGTVTLEEHAIINGDLVSPASYVNQKPGAQVQGDIIENWSAPMDNINIPTFWSMPHRTSQVRFVPIINRIGRGIATLFVILALSALLLLIMPKSSDTMAAALRAEPWHILGYGALTLLVVLIGSVLLAITICLIPVAILALMITGIGIITGWLVLGYELGKRMAEDLFKTKWHPVLSAVLGNLVLFLVAAGLEFIPCIGWIPIFAAMLFSLGMAVVTLFGTQSYPRGQMRQKPQQEVLVDGTKSKAEDAAVISPPPAEEPQNEPPEVPSTDGAESIEDASDDSEDENA